MKIDPQNLSGAQKAAIFLLKMGEEYASDILQKMTDEEIKKTATAMAKIDEIPPEMLNAVMSEFIENYEDKDRLVVQGESFIKNVIDKSLNKQKAQAIHAELNKRKHDKPFAWCQNVDVNTLATQISGEHPQTIAMILAYLSPEIASEILVMLSDDLKGDIAMRIAQLGQVPDEIVGAVDRALREKIGKIGESGAEAGGVETLVGILNSVDRSTEEIIMESIEDEHSTMATEIREMMFVFEDLSSIDDRGMREILKRVESNQLVLAMKTASEEMKEKIFGNLSSRAAEMLREDLEVMGPVRLTEVEEAQQAIIRAAKELEAEGTIVLGGKGKEDILV